MTEVKNYNTNFRYWGNPNIRYYLSDFGSEEHFYIDYSDYNEQNSNDSYSNEEIDIDIAAEALKNKFKSDSSNDLSNEEIEYMSAGGESEIFSAGKKVVKVFCKENLLRKSCSDLKIELEKQQFILQGINGLARPLKTDTVEIKTINYPIQVTKYMENGTLFDFINNGYTEKPSKFEIAIKLALIVFRLHQMGLVHNDLKPENIFFNYKNNVKIGDFSFILELDAEEREPLGTMGYFAPECANFKGEAKTIKPSLAVDIYSLGVIFFQLFLPHHYKPWNVFLEEHYEDYKDSCNEEQEIIAKCYIDYCKNLIKILNNIKKNTYFDLDELHLYTSRNEPKIKLVDLLLGMLDIEPKKRPNIKQVKEKLTEIYKIVKNDYIYGKIPINLKNRELLELGISKNLNFKEEEIKKMEKNLFLRIKTILNRKNSSNTLKSNLIDVVNYMFPESYIKFKIKKDKDLTLKDKLILDGLVNQSDNLRVARMIYFKKNKIYEKDKARAEKLVDTLNGIEKLFSNETVDFSYNL